MVKVLVLGSTGMLGNAVSNWFTENTRYETFLSYRDEEASRLLRLGSNFVDNIKFDCTKDNFEILPDVDYIINCIGTIKPFMAADPAAAIEINSVFPWKLSEYCEKTNTKLIHITTDCVYSGKKGSYTEEDSHDALDEYGKSKSIGEPNNCMVLRTSIIGEEIHKNGSLIEWVKGQRGKTINGFTNHFWNGITTKQYAKICDQIIVENLYELNRFHVMSPYSVNKHELVSLLNNKYNLDITIEEFQTPEVVDRSLSTVKKLNELLFIPSIEKQIEEL